MNRLKRFFVMPYLLVCLVAGGHSLWELLSAETFNIGWLGAVIALLPMPLFMLWLAISGAARTSRYMPLQLAGALLGSLLVAIDLEPLQTFYALLPGLGGALAYVFWYSSLGREGNAKLAQGQILPDFELQDADGQTVSSASFRGRKALFLFYRGNWCPLCVAQIKEVAERYRRLDDRGVSVIMVSPQGQQHTKAIAKRFDVPMRFLSDPDLSAAKSLGILHAGGVPAGIQGYDRDTVYPTAIVVDELGKILYCDQTDNYRVRPEPDAFLRVVEGEPVLAG